ncbi:MAG: hypothetical protein KDJ75_04605 [Alphaproteobacteria bacterium]|nr:hypothetical protein [Alphaproteobacteria bacterium]
MMRVFQSFCLTVLLLSGPLSLAAQAEQTQRKEFSPGIHYTAIGNKNASQEENTPAASQGTHESAAEETDPENAAEAPSEHDRIWNRYKALAAGQNPDEAKPDEQPEQKQSALPKTPVKPQKATAPTAQNMSARTRAQPRSQQRMDPKAGRDETLPQPAGLASIIEEYRRTKDQRREMKHLRISEPEIPVAPESETPPSPEPPKPKVPHTAGVSGQSR